VRHALGTIVLNEEAFLRRHLPVWSQAYDTIIAVDGGSTDGTVDVLLSCGAHVTLRPWDWDFAAARNTVIFVVEHMKDHYADTLLMLDADEIMFPDDMRRVQEALVTSKVIRFPRYNFVGDARHYCPDRPLYPDLQTRAFRLNLGLRYRGQVHECLDEGGVGLRPDEIVHQFDGHIYHYGLLRDVRRLALKWENYRRLVCGAPVLKELPESWNETVSAGSAPFVGPQPIDAEYSAL